MDTDFDYSSFHFIIHSTVKYSFICLSDIGQEINSSDLENLSEDTISDSQNGQKLRKLIDYIRMQSPGRIIPLVISTGQEGCLKFEGLLQKLIQDAFQAPGLNVSYFDFYTNNLKGISRFF